MRASSFSPTGRNKMTASLVSIGALSVRNGDPRPRLDPVAESPDPGADIEDRFGVLQQVEVERLPRDRLQVEGEVDRHQRVDEQLALRGSLREGDVPELPFESCGDAPV